MMQADREGTLDASISRSIRAIASDYFDSLGRRFPYHCASADFYFFPRSENALAEQAILLRLVCPVVERFGLLDLAVAPGDDLIRAGETYPKALDGVG